MLLVDDAQHDPLAVAGTERSVARNTAAENRPTFDLQCRQRAGPCRENVGHRDVDVVAFAATAGADERGAHGHGGEDTGGEIGDRWTADHRFAARAAWLDDAGVRLVVEVVTR